MRIIVSDSSSLIDLKKGKLLTYFLELPFELAIPQSMFEDELLGFTAAEIRMMRKTMTCANLDSDAMARVHKKQHALPALTVYDCMAFVLSENLDAAVLLTGDRRLRMAAEAERIECHGILWVIEQLSAHKLVTREVLLLALERWRDDGYVRLPHADLQRAIAKYRNP